MRSRRAHCPARRSWPGRRRGALYAATPYARAASLIVRGAHLGGRIETLANRSQYAVEARAGPQASRPATGRCRPASMCPRDGRLSGHRHPRHPFRGYRRGTLDGALAAARGHRPDVMTIALPDLQATASRRTPRTPSKSGRLAGRTARPMRRMARSGSSASVRRRTVDRGGGPAGDQGQAGLRPVVRRARGPAARHALPGHRRGNAGPRRDAPPAARLRGRRHPARARRSRRGPGRQVAALREGIETFLLASQQTVLEPDLAVQDVARAREYEKTLPEPSRTYLHYVNERDTKQLGRGAVPYLDQLGADDPALSPDRAHRAGRAGISPARRRDTVIPAVESALLGRVPAQPGARTSTCS